MTWSEEAFYRETAVRAGAILGAAVHVRQVKVAYLLTEGYDDERVARELRVGRRTVQRDVAALARTLGARSRFELAFALGMLWERLQRQRPRESPYRMRRRVSE